MLKTYSELPWSYRPCHWLRGEYFAIFFSADKNLSSEDIFNSEGAISISMKMTIIYLGFFLMADFKPSEQHMQEVYKTSNILRKAKEKWSCETPESFCLYVRHLGTFFWNVQLKHWIPNYPGIRMHWEKCRDPMELSPALKTTSGCHSWAAPIIMQKEEATQFKDE